MISAILWGTSLLQVLEKHTEVCINHLVTFTQRACLWSLALFSPFTLYYPVPFSIDVAHISIREPWILPGIWLDLCIVNLLCLMQVRWKLCNFPFLGQETNPRGEIEEAWDEKTDKWSRSLPDKDNPSLSRILWLTDLCFELLFFWPCIYRPWKMLLSDPVHRQEWDHPLRPGLFSYAGRHPE